MPEDFAQALARTPDGYLWIGTSGGLVRFDGLRLTVFSRENQPAFQDDSFYSLYVTRDGTLWGGTESGATAHIERLNNTLRQRISRLVRKALSFSKKEYMLNLHFKLFAVHYNLECVNY